MTEENSAWCPSCGNAVGADDAFCRSCGHSLAAPHTVPSQPPRAEATTSTPIANVQTDDGDRWRRRFIISALAVLVVAIAVIAIVVVGNSNSNPAASKRKRAEAAQRAFKARLNAPFQAAMGQRTKYFVAEAAFLSATRDAKAKLHRYQSEVQKVEHEDTEISNANSGLEKACSEPLSNVPCPNPTYPSYPNAPNVQQDVSGLRSAAAGASSLNAEVLAAAPQPELKVFYVQLQAAIAALTTDAQYNATNLSEAVTEPANNGPGTVEQKKASTLHGETGLPSVRLMNAEAVKLIQRLGLPISQYDVPGGTDANPTDHSVAQ